MKSLAKAIMSTLLMALLVLAEPAIPASASGPSWWSNAYGSRLQVTISLAGAVVPVSYSTAVVIDHAAMVAKGLSLANGDDVRIARFSGGSWTELDRFKDVSSAWNTSATKLWFRTQAAIPAGTPDTSYWIYLANPAASAPPANGKNVFEIYDDFSDGAIDSAVWDVSLGDGTTVTETGGKLVAAGTSTSYSYADTGILTKQSYRDDYASEVTFEVVAATGSDIQERVIKPGMDQETYVLTGNPLRIKELGGNTDFRASTITGTTFGPQRVVMTKSIDGMARIYENGSLSQARSMGIGAFHPVNFGYAPRMINQTFEARFDDAIVRRVLSVEPTVSVESLSAAASALAVLVPPSLTFTVGAKADACNTATPTAGTSSTSTGVGLGRLAAGGVSTAGQELSLVGNAASGAVVYVQGRSPRLGSDYLTDVPGTNGLPVAFPGGEAFGYTVSATGLPGGVATRFLVTGVPQWAALSSTEAPILYGANVTTAVTGCIAYRTAIAADSQAGTYVGDVTYTAVGTF